MDAETSQAYLIITLLLSLNAVLLAVVGFFIKGLIAKFTLSIERITSAMAHVDKTMAVMEANVGNYNKNLEHLSFVEVRLDKEIKGLRERVHDVVNHLSKLEATILTSEKFTMVDE